MKRLTPEQQQLIMDFYFRCGDEKDINQGRDLIASNPEAAKLYAGLEKTLGELGGVKYEPCPDNLAQLTIARLKLAARAVKSGISKDSRLKDLLDEETRKDVLHPPPSSSRHPAVSSSPARPNFLRVSFEIAAMAAAVVLISGFLFPAFFTMRAHSRKIACMANLGRVGRAMRTYANDNEGRIISAQIPPGSTWWKVGDQSEGSFSSTRYVWQLVRQGYVDPKNFICKGHRNAQTLSCESSQLAQMQDFPSLNYISYSVMLVCNKKNPESVQKRTIVMSDMNPVFARFRKASGIYNRQDGFGKICLDEDLKKLLSPNHNQRGQNVLFCDGGVDFLEFREYEGDDIFTVQGIDEYTGRELPADENDTFLAP